MSTIGYIITANRKETAQMPTQKYIITVSSDEYDANYLLGQYSISNILTNAFTPYGYVQLDSIELYDPENLADHTKISAIKHIRKALDCSLVDAKFLTDYAQTRGESKWGKVKVYYDSRNETYRVVVNQP